MILAHAYPQTCGRTLYCSIQPTAWSYDSPARGGLQYKPSYEGDIIPKRGQYIFYLIKIGVITLENKRQTSYKEVKIGGTLYRVTSVFTGEKDLAKTLEQLAIRKVMAEKNAS